MGLTLEDITTWDSIWNVLPKNSMLVFSPAASEGGILITNGFLPASMKSAWMTLVMYKVGTKSLCILYHLQYPEYEIYLAQREGSSISNVWNGWFKLSCTKI